MGTGLGSFLDFLYARVVGTSVTGAGQGLRRSWPGERSAHGVGGSSLGWPVRWEGDWVRSLIFTRACEGLPFAAG